MSGERASQEQQVQSLEVGMNLTASQWRKSLKCKREGGRGRQGPGSPRNLGLFQWHSWKTRSTGTLLLTSTKMALRVGKASRDRC